MGFSFFRCVHAGWLLCACTSAHARREKGAPVVRGVRGYDVGRTRRARGGPGGRVPRGARTKERRMSEGDPTRPPPHRALLRPCHTPLPTFARTRARAVSTHSVPFIPPPMRRHSACLAAVLLALSAAVAQVCSREAPARRGKHKKMIRHPHPALSHPLPLARSLSPALSHPLPLTRSPSPPTRPPPTSPRWPPCSQNFGCVGCCLWWLGRGWRPHALSPPRPRFVRVVRLHAHALFPIAPLTPLDPPHLPLIPQGLEAEVDSVISDKVRVGGCVPQRGRDAAARSHTRPWTGLHDGARRRRRRSLLAPRRPHRPSSAPRPPVAVIQDLRRARTLRG